ncbi:hypothetical protein EVAR_99567_1 [Eumeta japonica]|uniref:Uncharacterized protein n=1 Tax=Eumeta variegata TaxID=151549 RepID=A0A4C1YWK0_EUMVA|nr:hypothetical protein EVAR_99567_1 [Eumeta japonica]
MTAIGSKYYRILICAQRNGRQSFKQPAIINAKQSYNLVTKRAQISHNGIQQCCKLLTVNLLRDRVTRTELQYKARNFAAVKFVTKSSRKIGKRWTRRKSQGAQHLRRI